MKRNQSLVCMLAFSLAGSVAQAQDPAPRTEGQRSTRSQNGEAVATVPQSGPNLDLLNLIAGFQGQRRGGPAAPGNNPDLVGEIRLITAPVDGARGAAGAWWTNTALMNRLGITDVQKARIENAFETHKQSLTTARENLEKEEAQLARLLESESVDRPTVTGQINRVVQARADMERINSTMTLEMREQLTRAQWVQLQSQPGLSLSLAAVRNPAGIGAPGQTAGGGRGGRGGIGAGQAAGATTDGPPGAMRIGAQVAQANLVNNVQAQYPPLARAARVQGVVQLQVVIDKAGTVTDVKVLSGHPLLNDSAVTAVQQWRYKPMLLNGQPTEVVTTVTVNFSFQ